MNIVLSTLPARTSPTAFRLRVVHVKLQSESPNALKLWYAEAVPTNAVPTNTLVAQYPWSLRVLGHDVWIGEGVWETADFEVYLEQLLAGTMHVGAYQLPVSLLSRPPVLLTQEAQDHALVPEPDQCAWLYELWDDRKAVQELRTQSPKILIGRINQHIQSIMGADLNQFSDRIGNVLVFVPTGIRLNTRKDAVTDDWIFQTDLPPEETSAYSIQVEFHDAQGLLDARSVQFTDVNARVPNLPQASGMRYSIWRDGRLLWRSTLNAINFDFGLHTRWVVGTRSGIQYTHGEQQATSTREPWVRWSRRRRVTNDVARLADSLEFKFYVPKRPNGQAARHEAHNDLRSLLNQARSSVRIWDPYFGTGDDDLTLIEAITELSVRVRILTSSADWQEQQAPPAEAPLATDSPISEERHASLPEQPFLSRLQQQLALQSLKLPDRWRTVDVKAWVLRKETAFHDRFIILDQEDPDRQRVWSLGSSINGLGNKHSALLRMSRPEEVIVAFEDLWEGRNELPWGHILDVFHGA